MFEETSLDALCCRSVSGQGGSGEHQSELSHPETYLQCASIMHYSIALSCMTTLELELGRRRK